PAVQPVVHHGARDRQRGRGVGVPEPHRAGTADAGRDAEPRPRRDQRRRHRPGGHAHVLHRLRPGRGRRGGADADRPGRPGAGHLLHRRRLPGRRRRRPGTARRRGDRRRRARPAELLRRVLDRRQPREGHRLRGDRRLPPIPSAGTVRHPIEGTVVSITTKDATAGTARRAPDGRGLRERLGGPAVFCAVAVLALVAAPLLLEPFRLNLLAKYLVYAIVALGIGLAWGQGGMLTLGQGVFFGLGGYSMGMHLKLTEAQGGLPDFMVWSGVEELPALWVPFADPVFALATAVLAPVALAALLGTLIFRQRVRGAYFAILTQALAAAFAILLVGRQGLTGGTSGLTNFFELF